MVSDQCWGWVEYRVIRLVVLLFYDIDAYLLIHNDKVNKQKNK